MKASTTKQQTAATRARVYIAVMYILLCLGVAGSFFMSKRSIDNEYHKMAITAANSIFETIVAVRTWNAGHGGVYVLVTDDTLPNPYLDDPRRDITTPDVRLTKINPAYMTRQIADVLKSKEGVHIHITSKNPLRPGNKPDPWEERALDSFEAGRRREILIEETGGDPYFRYMAPLRTEQACLNCHEKQGYRIGDVRGGISVSFSYAPYQAAISRTTMRMYAGHFVFRLLCLACIYFLGGKLVRHIVELQAARSKIRTLEGFLPICSHCKKIRIEGADAHDQESWVAVETYIRDRTDAEFTHGLCPECKKKLYPKLDSENKTKA